MEGKTLSLVPARRWSGRRRVGSGERLFPLFQRSAGLIRRDAGSEERSFPSFRGDTGTSEEALDRGKDSFPSSNEAPDCYGETSDRGKEAFPPSGETSSPSGVALPYRFFWYGIPNARGAREWPMTRSDILNPTTRALE